MTEIEFPDASEKTDTRPTQATTRETMKDETGFPLPPFYEPTGSAENNTPATRSIGKRIAGTIKETLETIIPAIVIALLINLFLAQATRVYGQSMEPNLHTD